MAGMSALLAVLLGWVRNRGLVECRVCLFEQFWIETEHEMKKETEKETIVDIGKESKKKIENGTTIETRSTAETTIETEKGQNTSYQNEINV